MKPVDMKVCVCVGIEQIIECGGVEGWGREFHFLKEQKSQSV
jgi:hypothetical protein